MLRQADEMLLNASSALKQLENATVLEISTKCDAAVAALDQFAEYAGSAAEQMADRTSTTLADMSTGRYGIEQTSVPTVDFSPDSSNSAGQGALLPAEAAPKPAPALQRAVASGYSAIANGVLSVLEAIVPGERPETPPASKRERLGNLFGYGGNTTRGAAVAAADAGKAAAQKPTAGQGK